MGNKEMGKSDNQLQETWVMYRKGTITVELYIVKQNNSSFIIKYPYVMYSTLKPINIYCRWDDDYWEFVQIKAIFL